MIKVTKTRPGLQLRLTDEVRAGGVVAAFKHYDPIVIEGQSLHVNVFCLHCLALCWDGQGAAGRGARTNGGGQVLRQGGKGAQSGQGAAGRGAKTDGGRQVLRQTKLAAQLILMIISYYNMAVCACVCSHCPPLCRLLQHGQGTAGGWLTRKGGGRQVLKWHMAQALTQLAP